jgi:flavin reductase (DIM6/NTAB) family NADH-FMN oxidoreductase RutF
MAASWLPADRDATQFRQRKRCRLCRLVSAAAGRKGATMDRHFYRTEDGHGLPHDPFNAIVGPRPIGWISTAGQDGRFNLAPYSFFNAFNYRPPIVGFASIGWKDTARNIADTGEFCWNLVSRALAEPMNVTSADLPPGTSEFDVAGLRPAPGRIVGAPLVASARVSFECRRTQMVRLADTEGQEVDTWLILGQVVGVHIDPTLLVDGVYQTDAAEPLLRGGGIGDYYSITRDTHMFMRRPTAAEALQRAKRDEA